MISGDTIPAPTQQAQLLGKRKSPKALKQKNVSWPAKDMLHQQMRFFAVDDAPFVIGVNIKDHQSSSVQDFLPKNDILTVSTKRAKLDDGTKHFMAMQTQKKWQCPSKIVYDPQWQVTNCSESTEIKKQLQRESRLLEVVYPRNIAIPPSPAEPQEVNAEDIDDSRVYEISLLPVEEDKEPNPLNESGEEVKGGIPAYCNNKQEEICSPDGGCDNSDMKKVRKTVEDAAVGGGELFLLQSLNNGDAGAGAAIVLAAAGLRNGGDMIDFNLLQELLSNPEMVQALTHSSSDKDASGNSIDQVISRLLKTGPPKTSSTLPAATSNSAVSTVEGVGMGSFGPVGGTPINMHDNNNQPPVFHAFHRAPSHVGSPPTQDYYKELIHQHGTTRGAISSSIESRAFQPPLPMFGPVSSFMPISTITTAMTSTTFIPASFSTAQAPIIRLPSSNSSSSNSNSYSNSSALQMPLSPNYPAPRPLLFVPPLQAGPGLTYTRDDNFHNWSCNLNRERAPISDYEFGRWQGNDTITNTTAFGPPTPMSQDGRGGGSLEIDIGRMKSHRSCVYFNSLNGCRFGEKCDFMHQPPIVPKQEPFQCSRGTPPHYPPPLPHHHHHHHLRNLAASGKVLKETR